MKASPLLISWHNDNAPVYSAHFEPNGKGRLATAGGDNNVRIWKVETEGDERKITYLSTLSRHSQAVNVVRWSPKGEMIATAGDDANAIIWVPNSLHNATATFGEDGLEDKESWRPKHMNRQGGSDIYDLAWSPDGNFFITGSMDNVARIYDAHTGQVIRQIAEHNHYVQGVAWDPLNEFVATQSSDRSVHIYNLRTKEGDFTLYNKVTRMDLPGRRISASSPAPPETNLRSKVQVEALTLAPASPAPSASIASIPGTPTTLSLPMDPPPPTSHSRRSSFGTPMHRSASPAPSMPLPAVRPMESSPNPFAAGLGLKNTSIYANETYTSFFRRLTFASDGSLLFTPAGQYKVSHPSLNGAKPIEDITNTVYIYTRAGFNKPPVAHLPGHKKPSIAVKCSPIYYTHRSNIKKPIHITIDTSSADEAIPALPDPVVPTRSSAASMDPPPPSAYPMTMPSPSERARPTSSPREPDTGTASASSAPAFALPYRMVYAVATQDAVLVYDTQQLTPICVVSNLHLATFTDLTWSPDGLTLIMSSSDGFCSTIAFSSGELGQIYTGTVPTAHNHNHMATPVHASPRPSPVALVSSGHKRGSASGSGLAQVPTSNARPTSPSKSRSNSVSSIATQASHVPSASAPVGNSPTPTLGVVPSLAAAHSGPVGVPMNTPPMTPASAASLTGSMAGSVLGKRDAGGLSESDQDDGRNAVKKRRIAPTLMDSSGGSR